MKNAGFFVGTIAGLLLFALIGAAVDPNVAHFPAISLNGKTNVISDSGTAPTWNGGAWPGGGSSPWVNVAGTIQPADGQTTNTLKFVSGLTDSDTNNGAIIDTAIPWTDDNAQLLTVRNSSTNVLGVDRQGGIVVGPNSTNVWGGTFAPGTFLSVHSPALGDPDFNEFFLATGGPSPVGDTSMDIYGSTGDYNLAFSAAPSPLGGSWGLFSEVATNLTRLQLGAGFGSNETNIFTRLDPTIADGSGAYKFGVYTNHTSGPLMDVFNGGTNKVASISFDGSISAANTNQWKLGSVKASSVTASTTNYVEVIIDGATVKLIKAN